MNLRFSFLKICFVLLFLLSGTAFAQTPQVWFSETEIEFELKTENKIDHTLEFASRGLLRESVDGEKVSGYKHEFVELTYAPVYIISENKEFSFGVRYRWSRLFNETEYNELRLIPQYEISHPAGIVDASHEFRLEQRFEGPDYTLRPRYQLGISKDISSKFAAELSTESLWSMSPQYNPEYEQRFALEIENASIKDIELIFGLEFRLEDYTGELEHEYFILTGANIQL